MTTELSEAQAVDLWACRVEYKALTPIIGVAVDMRVVGDNWDENSYPDCRALRGPYDHSICEQAHVTASSGSPADENDAGKNEQECEWKDRRDRFAKKRDRQKLPGAGADPAYLADAYRSAQLLENEE